MGCDFVARKAPVCKCPEGWVPLFGEWCQAGPTNFYQAALEECLTCAEKSDGCKSCYDLGEKQEYYSGPISCVRGTPGGNPEVESNGTISFIKILQCYECSPSDPLPDHCSPPPPPSPGSPGSPGSPTPPPPPPPTPGCINGGWVPSVPFIGFD